MKDTFINFRNINILKKNSQCYLYFKIANCAIKIDPLSNICWGCNTFKNIKQDIFKCSGNTHLNLNNFSIALLLDDISCRKVKTSRYHIIL